ncbi:MAG: outer membrane lipoprotein chaperone LolA [Epsilonproteobacteria bacterium]|nr:outer membrane lipoprotein chaperone LolA [Campylobacterota bacterium]NPA57455.1 outer membrane lipoprotein chaperone LolA [Campylobacterota bacterium]
MGRALIALLALSLLLWGGRGLDVRTFSSDFVQKVRNDQNRTIEYRGTVYFQAPNLTHWIYREPIEKEILFDGRRLIMVEPQLEQVTITSLKREENILALLQRAREVEPGIYHLELNGKEFQIETGKGGKIERILYRDDLGNDVEITFLNPKQNGELSPSLFQIEIPPSYDRIYEE